MAAAVRVVLDTNVLLSLYVFADSRYAPLGERLASGAWLALTDDACLSEFRRVLGYPIFKLDTAAQDSAHAAYAVIAEHLADRAAAPVKLPQCRDPDDQKFLELARDGNARLLVTSDKALLALARRKQLRDLFRILTPEAALSCLAPA